MRLLRVGLTVLTCACSGGDPGSALPSADNGGAAGDSSALADAGPTDSATPPTDVATEGVTDPQVGTIAGVCSLGRPLAGATVEVLRFDGLERGASLGQGTTDVSGHFEVATTDPAYKGRILIRAAGTAATYTELAGGETRHFDPDDELMATTLFDAGEGRAGLTVNALTTLAVRLAEAYASTATPESASADAHGRLVDHVYRPKAFDALATPVADVTTEPAAWPAPKTAVGLFHAGLSRLAADFGAKGSVTVATQDLVQALGSDLAADGLLDGLGGGGATVALLGQFPLDDQTTRWALAAAAGAVVTEAAPLNLTYEVLAAEDGFYTLVSTDTGPLYPKGTPVTRYDLVAPDVEFADPTPAAGSAHGQPFKVRAVASDVSPLASIEIFGAEGVTIEVDLEAKSATATIDPKAIVDGDVDVLVRARTRPGTWVRRRVPSSRTRRRRW